MNSFERNIINKLLDKYENSKLSKEGLSINREIKLTTKDPELKTYTTIDSYKYVDDNDEVLKKLENNNFIKTDYYNGVFKSLVLVVDNVNSLYKYINRKNPKDELEQVKSILCSKDYSGLIKDFVDYTLNFINEKYSYPKTYFEDSEQLTLILKTLDNILSLDCEIKKRDFSAKYLGDSKLFEKIESKIIKIIKDFDSNTYDSDDEVLSNYNIVKNTSYVMIKNKLEFKLNDETINLDKFGFEFSLSDEMINNIQIIKTNINKIITVENLTSFYSFEDKNALIIYLAGFHNHTKQELLKKIYLIYPKAEYYHFGDIDAGGFWILNSLKEKTGINFKAYHMGIEDFKNKSTKSLTQNDKKRLILMLNDNRFVSYFDVLNYMLENNVKLEQEQLD